MGSVWQDRPCIMVDVRHSEQLLSSEHCWNPQPKVEPVVVVDTELPSIQLVERNTTFH